MTQLAEDILNGDEQLLSDLAQLSSHHLVCHCIPKACHGHVLSMVAAWASIQVGEMYRDQMDITDLSNMLQKHIK